MTIYIMRNITAIKIIKHNHNNHNNIKSIYFRSQLSKDDANKPLTHAIAAVL